MPTLVRLLTVLAILAGIVYAIMAALVSFVEPRQGRMSVDVPLEGLSQPVERRMPDLPE